MKRFVLFLFFLVLAIPALSATVETAFSPDGGGEDLVLRTLNSAQSSIELSAYAFTSAKVAKALLDAHKRGATVRVVADGKANNSHASKAAMNALTLAGIEVRLNNRYAIHHDKFAVIDRKTVQTGSFNYSASAARKNSENVVVIKNDPETTLKFQRHWQSRFDTGERYQLPY